MGVRSRSGGESVREAIWCIGYVRGRGLCHAGDDAGRWPLAWVREAFVTNWLKLAVDGGFIVGGSEVDDGIRRFDHEVESGDGSPWLVGQDSHQAGQDGRRSPQNRRLKQNYEMPHQAPSHATRPYGERLKTPDTPGRSRSWWCGVF